MEELILIQKNQDTWTYKHKLGNINHLSYIPNQKSSAPKDKKEEEEEEESPRPQKIHSVLKSSQITKY